MKSGFLLLFCLLFSLHSMLWAQSNFTPLERGDLEEREEHWAISPGLKLNGDYRARARQLNNNDFPKPFLGESDPSDQWLFDHDLRLHFHTIMHRHIALHLELETVQEPFNDSDLRNASSSRRQLAPDGQVSGVQARQAYLEYNANPKSILRIGKQYVRMGDRRGKVFSGLLSGVTHSCKAGTWCYGLEGLKTGTHPADWIYGLSLLYPIIERRNPAGQITNLLEVEVFRIFYTERDIPLGNRNHPTFRNESIEEQVQEAFASGDAARIAEVTQRSRHVVDQAGNPIYYDAIRQEYFGMRLAWKSENWELDLDITANQGRRFYHSKRVDGVKLEAPQLGEGREDDFRSRARSKEAVAGLANEISLAYRNGSHRFEFRNLFATGDKEKGDVDDVQTAFEGDNFLRTLNGYYEIAPGSYRGTNLYFNGGDDGLRAGTGLGHSVNNTIVTGGTYEYTASSDPFRYQLGIFYLRKHRSVLNEEGKSVRVIGTEIDNTFAFVLDKHLQLEGELNFLQPDEAFSFSHDAAPQEDQSLIVHGVARVIYSF